MPSVNVPGVGKVNFPDSMSQQEIVSAIQGMSGPRASVGVGGGVDLADDEPKSLTRRVMEDSPVGHAAGVMKGLGSTLYGASAAVNRFGGDALREKLVEAGIPGAGPADAALDQFYAEKPEILEPQGATQKFGAVIGETLPYLAPGGAIARAGKAAQAATGSRVVGGLARAGLEGASAGVITGAQSGGDLDAAGESAALATGLTAGMGAGGAVAGNAIEAISKVPASQAISNFLKNSAKKSYASMLGANRSEKLRAAAVAEGLVDRAEMFRSAKNFADKTERTINELKAARDLAWESIDPLEKATLQVPLDKINNAIDLHAAQAFMSETPSAVMTVLPEQQAALGELEGLKKTLAYFAEDGVVNVKWLERAKETLQHWANRAGAYNIDKANAALSVEARKDVARIVRQEFDELVPDVGRINKEISFQKKVLDFASTLESTSLIRRAGAITAGGGLAGGTYAGYRVARGDDPMKAMERGAQLGIMSAGLGGLVSSVAWKSVNAATKAHLADLIGAGKVEKVTEIMRRIAVAQQGRPDSGASGY
jgi:hypothetical protein